MKFNILDMIIAMNLMMLLEHLEKEEKEHGVQCLGLDMNPQMVINLK